MAGPPVDSAFPPPADPGALLVEALAAHQAGDLAGAGRLYERILATHPDHPDALHLSGVLCQQRGDPEEAVARIGQAVALDPDFAAARVNLANALADLGRHGEAIDHYRAALRAEPANAVAHLNMGNALRALGRPAEACQAYQTASRLRPDMPEALFALGNLLRARGALGPALAALQRVVELRPGDIDALTDLGGVLDELGRHAEAADVLRHAATLDPTAAIARFNLGNSLQALGDPLGAAAAYEDALGADPELIEAHDRLGVLLLQTLCDPAAALPHLEAAANTAPTDAKRRSALLLAMQYSEAIDEADLARAHRTFGKLFGPPPQRPPRRRRKPGEPLRVGLVSGDFRRHANLFFLPPLLDHRDPSRWTAILYSNVARPDSATEMFRRSADLFVDIAGLDDAVAQRRVAADGIDILIDLNGHTHGNRLPLFARRPAPIQATWLDYVGSSGLAQMDFILSDARHLPPEHEDQYVERVLRFPVDRFCYAPPAEAPDPAPPPRRSAGHLTFGSFNAAFKIGPACLDLWAAVLAAVPGARLLLASPPLALAATRDRFIGAFADRGIGAERVDLLGPAPQAEMLARYGRVDIALDTQPYSGGLTTLEALWMGVPVIAMPGRRGASNHAAAHLRAAGLGDLVADGPAGYARLAAGLAADGARLDAYRNDLRRIIAASPLVDGPAFARAFEDLLSRMDGEVPA